MVTFPTIALASALSALSLFVTRFRFELANTAALLSAKLT